MRAILLCAALGACSTTTVVPGVADQHGACVALEGRMFTTTQPQSDCGLPAPNAPPSTCNWTIRFETSSSSQSTAQWQWSDTAETFPIACDGAVIKSASAQTMYSGFYNESTGELTWDGVSYRD